MNSNDITCWAHNTFHVEWGDPLACLYADESLSTAEIAGALTALSAFVLTVIVVRRFFRNGYSPWWLTRLWVGVMFVSGMFGVFRLLS